MFTNLIYDIFIVHYKTPTTQHLKHSETLQNTPKHSKTMVCSHCNCPGHNARTCPILHPDIPTGLEKKIAKNLVKLLDSPEEKENPFAELPRGPICEAKKVSKPLEGLAGCKNIWKEAPARVPKKVSKPLEGLAGCKNIWKEAPVKVHKKVSKPLEGLAGCKNIWKKSPADRSNKGNTECRICGEMGHNSRTCPTKCVPCVRNTEIFQLANGDMITLDLGPEQ
jgi:hypothetical protein